MYSFAIHLYAFTVALISPFHRKARMMRLGQWKTNGILREKIDQKAKYIWVHASSLGEFEQGRPLIEKIKAQYPDYKILLTFFSPSGFEVRKNYDGADVICYLPFDTPYRVKKFLNLARPEMAVFIKYEFWSNYLHELKRRDIPVYIISSIFRPDQVFFKWYGKNYSKVLHCFNHLFVQDEHSAGLLKTLGVENVTVCGDTRFDRVIDVRNQAREIPTVSRFVAQTSGKSYTLVAGSSWPQDEEIFIPYFNQHPELKLIIAPHEIHQEHLLYIESLLKRPSVRLSDVMNDPKLLTGKDCLIIDSFGMLSSIYRYGDIAYIGGGFGRGIHNTLEAAVYGMPVLFGPKYRKFKEASDLITSGGGFSVNSAQEFTDKMNVLLTDEVALKTAGKAAGDFVNTKAGVTDAILAALKIG